MPAYLVSCTLSGVVMRVTRTSWIALLLIFLVGIAVWWPVQAMPVARAANPEKVMVPTSFGDRRTIQAELHAEAMRPADTFEVYLTICSGTSKPEEVAAKIAAVPAAWPRPC